MKTDQPREPNSMPWWETAAMIASFALLWAYMLARQSALMTAARSGAVSPRPEMSPLWAVAQAVAIATLLLILVRRMKRARDAMREANQIRPGFPPGFVPTQPHRNGISKNGTAANHKEQRNGRAHAGGAGESGTAQETDTNVN